MCNRQATGPLALVLVFLAAGCVNPAPPPFTLAPTLAGGPPVQVRADACAVVIAEIVDARSDPETLGIYAGKAIKAPDDRQAWLHSMAMDLTRRGIRPLFGEAAATPAAGSPRIRFTLEKAWVSNVHDDIGAGVLLRIDELGAHPSTVRFRGTKQKMTYFSAGEGKLQASLNDAVSQALDGLAAHLRMRCGSA